MTDLGNYGPWVVIAGGSEGVGAEFARLLAAAGLNLVLLARNSGPLEATADECRQRGVEVRTLTVDLVDSSAIDRLFDATADLEVGLLIYNAGANTCSEQFLDGDLADFQRVIDLNIGAAMRLVQHYGRAMRDRRRGGILLVGSMAGYLGSVRHTVYGGVKAFGRIFAEGLWLELRDYNVHVLRARSRRHSHARDGAGRPELRRTGNARRRAGRRRPRRPRSAAERPCLRRGRQRRRRRPPQ